MHPGNLIISGIWFVNQFQNDPGLPVLLQNLAGAILGLVVGYDQTIDVQTRVITQMSLDDIDFIPHQQGHDNFGPLNAGATTPDREDRHNNDSLKFQLQKPFPDQFFILLITTYS